MKKKIIFFGTPSFAVTSLDKINSKFIVDYVVTSPDKRSGRGQKLNESDVKKYTLKNKIKTLQPSNLMDEEFINQIKGLKPDLDFRYFQLLGLFFSGRKRLELIAIKSAFCVFKSIIVSFPL